MKVASDHKWKIRGMEVVSDDKWKTGEGKSFLTISGSPVE